MDDIFIILGILYLLFRRRHKRRQRRRFYVRPTNRSRHQRGEGILVRELQMFDAENHQRYFRMGRQKFFYLLSLVGPHITRSRRHSLPIDPMIKLAVTIRLLATGDSQQTVAMSYRIGHSTVNGILYETCQAIWTALQEKLLPLPTSDFWKKKSSDFQMLWNFPHCLGAVDGKHIAIRAPSHSGSDFYNYKHFHSVVLLGCADANYTFTVVDIGARGRQSDGGVFADSAFGFSLENGTLQLPKCDAKNGLPYVFVADDAFPLKHYMMKPFARKNLSFKQKVYNYRLSRARRIIENAFGILAARWMIFKRPLLYSPANVVTITKAVILLHNFLTGSAATERGEKCYVTPGFVDHEDDNGVVIPGDWRSEIGSENAFVSVGRTGASNYSSTAAAVRDRFMDHFVSPSGRLPWQDATVNRGKLNA